MQKKIMKKTKTHNYGSRKTCLPLEFEAYWSFQMTSDVTCLTSYKNTKTMHWSGTLNKLNLHGFLDLANIRIFHTTRLTLSWDQALLSFSWKIENRPARRIEKSHIWYSICVPELRVLANRTMIVASFACTFTWLLWHQTDLKLNTRTFAATYHAY